MKTLKKLFNRNKSKRNILKTRRQERRSKQTLFSQTQIASLARYK